ncbi:uncharacterized protein LOC133532805 [Cydia pomonella]|uniref:uncharacterized protein LOC133532805 n=1 Tax=Cydia pomonella TaxID=82600 RepID=UPI002ADDF43A|nr:uncharacterized protein LOC133532805 [Cydia pomonella]
MESTREEDLHEFTVIQLKNELRSRYLPVTGNKDELVARLHQDNISKQEHGILEEYKRERTKRLSQEVELKNLQIQLDQIKKDEGNNGTAPEADKVSLILEGIWDSRWSIPLASHCCKDVEGLLSHAAA